VKRSIKTTNDEGGKTKSDPKDTEEKEKNKEEGKWKRQTDLCKE